jgi:glutathione S-transferase
MGTFPISWKKGTVLRQDCPLFRAPRGNGECPHFLEISNVPIFFKPAPDASATDKADAEVLLIKRLNWLAARMEGAYLFGDRPTVADLYLFVTLRWAARFGIQIPQALAALKQRLESRPEVRAAIAFEEVPALKAGNA